MQLTHSADEDLRRRQPAPLRDRTHRLRQGSLLSSAVWEGRPRRAEDAPAACGVLCVPPALPLTSGLTVFERTASGGDAEASTAVSATILPAKHSDEINILKLKGCSWR